MRTTIVALLAVLFAVVLALWNPRPSSGLVDAHYGCSSVKFSNYSADPVRFSYGVPRSGAVDELILAPGMSEVVRINASNFRWWAANAETGERLVGAGRGVDLIEQCRGPNPLPTVEADPRRSPVSWPWGLPRTGER
ncbi:MAG: hypothetical protein Q4F67_10425 [Propionibacteriaceae bacterium]|nr:hypothetical protein [Propionibacteriaceae bacterium]